MGNSVHFPAYKVMNYVNVYRKEDSFGMGVFSKVAHQGEGKKRK